MSNRLGLGKVVQMSSAENIESQMPMLKALDVSQANATVASDKDLVLSKIEDVDHFNRQLRDVVLHREHGIMCKYIRSRGLEVQALTNVLLSASTEDIDVAELLEELFVF